MSDRLGEPVEPRHGDLLAASERWHAKDLDEAFERLKASPKGLSVEEAQVRFASYGPNALPRGTPPSLLAIFLRQFKNPLVYLLLAAAIISLLVGEAVDAIFILVVLLFNAAIGTLQEWQAQKKALELDSLVPHHTLALRSDHWVNLDSTQVVPGDIVKLESGVQVSADLRLIDGRELVVDESLLTGESIPVGKEVTARVSPEASLADHRNMLFAGTTVLAGRARALVVETGAETQIGRIAQALTPAEAQPPPLVRQLERFSRLIGLATIVLIGFVALAQALQGTPLVTVFLVAIALAVAAIPEGLPVAISVALAIATNRMQRRKVIVRSLPAVEGLGACTLIASDKTGTLTCNELTLQSVVLFDGGEVTTEVEVTGKGYRSQGEVLVDGSSPSADCLDCLCLLAESASLCNEATYASGAKGTIRTGDTVDIAFLVFATKLGIDVSGLRESRVCIRTVPYEPERRFGAVLAKDRSGGAITAHVKGAAEAIIPMCGNIPEQRVTAEVERLAEAGYRVLAVARGEIPTAEVPPDPASSLHELDFLGLVGLIDPIRPEVPEAIELCRQAGISVCMITGDHPTTALAIARRLGLAQDRSEVAGEEEIRLLSAHPEAFSRFIQGKRIFARVAPLQKLDIVQAMQRQGHVVAVTGDGVNDAPALNAADIGVAMGESGTDVARDAADLIIADDNFASIVAGIEEGRVAYDNVRKLIYLLIATGFGEIVLFILAIIFGLPVPLFAVQLLWLNLVTNGIQDVALAFEKGEPGIERRAPRAPKQRLFDRRMTAQVLIAGSYMGTVSCIAYGWFLERGLAVEEARNLVLLLMVLFENAHALNARSERLSILQVPFRANPFLIAAIIGAQLLHVAALFTPGLAEVLRVAPMKLLDWVLVALLAASLILVMELFKHVYARLYGAED
jgi:Ca2+-transporting ATPase